MELSWQLVRLLYRFYRASKFWYFDACLFFLKDAKKWCDATKLNCTHAGCIIEVCAIPHCLRCFWKRTLKSHGTWSWAVWICLNRASDNFCLYIFMPNWGKKRKCVDTFIWIFLWIVIESLEFLKKTKKAGIVFLCILADTLTFSWTACPRLSEFKKSKF